MEYIIFIPLFIHQVLISEPDQEKDKLSTVFDQVHIVGVFTPRDISRN